MSAKFFCLGMDLAEAASLVLRSHRDGAMDALPADIQQLADALAAWDSALSETEAPCYEDEDRADDARARTKDMDAERGDWLDHSRRDEAGPR